MRAQKAAPTQKAASTKKATSASSNSGAWALALGAAGVVTVGLLIGLPSDDRTSMTLESAGYAATAVTAVATLPAAEAVPVVETTELRHSDAPAATARLAPPVEQAALVTITGCLETDDERFRLNDTKGSDAPKSRSWKTGFLKRRPAPMAVVDTNGVGLPAHVGELVSLTGTLADRNMHVRSLRRIAASCG